MQITQSFNRQIWFIVFMTNKINNTKVFLDFFPRCCINKKIECIFFKLEHPTVCSYSHLSFSMEQMSGT